MLRELLSRINFRDLNKVFRKIIYPFAVVCSFIDNISSKHDPEATTSKLNF